MNGDEEENEGNPFLMNSNVNDDGDMSDRHPGSTYGRNRNRNHRNNESLPYAVIDFVSALYHSDEVQQLLGMSLRFLPMGIMIIFAVFLISVMNKTHGEVARVPIPILPVVDELGISVETFSPTLTPVKGQVHENAGGLPESNDEGADFTDDDDFDIFDVRVPEGSVTEGYEPPPFSLDFAASSLSLTPYPKLKLGYYHCPSLHNDTLAFVSEGDIYLASALDPSIAVRLTTTTGNALHPHINPARPHLLAYTATYTGHREVYLADLRDPGSAPPKRLTYGVEPVHSISGWTADGNSVVYTKTGEGVGLLFSKMYAVDVKGVESKEIPLNEVTEGVWVDDCLYYVRFTQSSKTVRYKGGTAESLWGWCVGEDRAVPLTTDYVGGDKAPRIYEGNKLMFLSDRSVVDNITPTTYNLFVMDIPTKGEMYADADNVLAYLNKKIRPKWLTSVSCNHEGMSLMEYDVDTMTGNVILRIGADLHIVKKKDIIPALSSPRFTLKGPHAVLPIRLVSDFHLNRERIIPMDIADLTSIDIYITPFLQTTALMTMRGQAFLSPVLAEKPIPYEGAGQALPLRRYRLAPSQGRGGSTRIFSIKYMSESKQALVLATDPKSPTQELGFWLLDLDPSSPLPNLDKTPPLIGGRKTGGPTNKDGLGSIYADTLIVSPVGFDRAVWTDTDGRIVVLNLSDGKATLTVLPHQNENGEPMIGDSGTELEFSPGGRYLSIAHGAKNQFQIITLVDLGESQDAVILGRAVQATSSRFNSGSAYFGTQGVDTAVMFYLRDGNMVSDVGSPWGTRAPQPHFPERWSVFALPLEGDLEKAAFKDRGGVAELMEIPKEVLPESGLPETNATAPDVNNATTTDATSKDIEIIFGPDTAIFAQRAYRINTIPPRHYVAILSQPLDDPTTLLLVEKYHDGDEVIYLPTILSTTKSNENIPPLVNWSLRGFGTSSPRCHIYLHTTTDIAVLPNLSIYLSLLATPIAPTVDLSRMSVSVRPDLEYRQMFVDAWRMLRDYFYDPDMTSIDWAAVLRRYAPLVKRCAKREELDDLLGQMASELSALHVFVYGGDHNMPAATYLRDYHDFGSLGVTVRRDEGSINSID